MQYKMLGSSGIKISVVGLGLWAIGGTFWGGTDRAAAEKAIRQAIDSEVNFIDTAPAYGFGLAEEILGNAIKGRRDKVVLATKCGLVWDRPDGVFHYDFPIAGKDRGVKVYRNLKKESIKKELQKSLSLLGTDYIDLYITHWPDPETPAEETMQALVEMKDSGQIRAIGVSNVSVDILEDFSRYGTIDADQEKYSIIDRAVEPDQLSWCRKNNATLVAYSPLVMGLLTGKLDPNREFTSDDARVLFSPDRFKPESIKSANDLLKKFVGPVAEKHNATVGNIIVAYLVSGENVVALFGARNAVQAAENANAGNIVLEDEDKKAVEDFIKNYK